MENREKKLSEMYFMSFVQFFFTEDNTVISKPITSLLGINVFLHFISG